MLPAVPLRDASARRPANGFTASGTASTRRCGARALRPPAAGIMPGMPSLGALAQLSSALQGQLAVEVQKQQMMQQLLSMQLAAAAAPGPALATAPRAPEPPGPPPPHPAGPPPPLPPAGPPPP
eukprot:gene34339-33711_t